MEWRPGSAGMQLACGGGAAWSLFAVELGTARRSLFLVLGTSSVSPDPARFYVGVGGATMWDVLVTDLRSKSKVHLDEKRSFHGPWFGGRLRCKMLSDTDRVLHGMVNGIINSHLFARILEIRGFNSHASCSRCRERFKLMFDIIQLLICKLLA